MEQSGCQVGAACYASIVTAARAGPRTILCIDLDAFFVSVHRRLDPSLEGRPVVVGGRRGSRGVVTSASYEARRYGVRSAMPIAEAERLLRGVGDVAYVEPWRADYERASAEVRAVLDEELPVLEAASIDEFYADATPLLVGRRPWSPPGVEGPAAALALAAHVVGRVLAATGLPASIGIGTSKLVAKIATDEAKPRGALQVLPGSEAAFLAALPVEKIPGIGAKTAPRLHALGVREIGDLVGERAGIARALGAGAAAWLADAARGIDPAPVVERDGAVSVGHEETYERDVSDLAEIEAALTDLAERVAYRLRADGLVARRVTLKLRYGARRRRFVDGLLARDVYETVTRAETGAPTADGLELAGRARALLRAHWRAGEPLRLLGVSAGELAPEAAERTLFDDGADPPERRRLNETLDKVRERFGFGAIVRASALGPEG